MPGAGNPCGGDLWGAGALPLPSVAAAPEPLIEGTDDAEHYRFPGDPEQKEPCPKCKKSLSRGAIVCNHCGFNRETGTRLQRVYEKVAKQWEPGLGFPGRFGVFLAAGGLALAVTLMVALGDGDLFGLLASWLVGATLLAYVVGTYPRLNLARGKRGRVRLTKTWHICFIPLDAADIRWRGYERVVTSQSHHAGFLDWLTVVLLIPWGLIPAVLWWLYVVRPDQFDVALTKDHGVSTLLLFRGRSEAVAEEIAVTLRNVTGLT